MVGKKLALLVCCLLAALALARPALADAELPPVEVKASLTGSDSYASPVAGVIDPGRQIPAGQITDLTDLLKLGNSIYIQESSYGRQIFLRGLTDQDMRVLIDGSPMGQLGKYYAYSFPWESIPLENIERIEVIRGAGSVEFGNTLAGTINIITKKGARQLRSTAALNYGSFDDFKVNASNSGSQGKFDWFVGGSYRDRGAYLENNDLKQYNVSGAVGVDLGQAGSLRLTGFATRREEGLPLDDRINWNIWSNSQGYADGSKTKTDENTIIADYKSAWVDLSASYFQQKRDDDCYKNGWVTGDYQDYALDFKTPSVKAKLHHTHGDHTWKIGADYTYGDAVADWVYYNDGTERIEWKQDLAGVFAEDTWRLLPQLNLTMGLRYDYYKNTIDSDRGYINPGSDISDEGLSPRASLTYDLNEDWQAFAFAGHVFKAPTMADLYRWHSNHELISFAGRAVLRAYYGLAQPAGAPASLIPAQYIQGWKNMIGDLEATKGWDYELGLRKSGQNHALQINFFYQDLDDYVNIYPVSYPPTYNVDNVGLWGMELAGVYTFCQYLEAEAIYTWMANQTSGDPITEKLYGKNELFNAPDHVLNLTLRSRPLKPLLLEWQSQFVSSRFAGGAPGVPPQVAATTPKYEPMYELDPYWLHNIRASYTVRCQKTDVTFSAAVENIFNEECYIRLDYPLPGTLYYGGVSLAF